MHTSAKPATNGETLFLRTRYREEMNRQIVHESIHTRAGWTRSWLLFVDDEAVGFGSIAVAGPWKVRHTLFEFYVLPAQRRYAFRLFETLLEACGARFMEIQSDDLLLAAMFHTYARDTFSEAIVFQDRCTTRHVVEGATLRCMTADEETARSMHERQGGPNWELVLNGAVVGKGGILFHYNVPYGDLHMEIEEAARGRGLGAFLVQELKRKAYELGAIPGARCNPKNVASRRTLQKAGFAATAHMLVGSLGEG
jgi:GNAT superfamily N-acetyltransferase